MSESWRKAFGAHFKGGNDRNRPRKAKLLATTYCRSDARAAFPVADRQLTSATNHVVTAQI